MGNSSKRRPHLSDNSASQATIGGPLQFGHPILSVRTYRPPDGGCAEALCVYIGLRGLNQDHWCACDVDNTYLEPVDNAACAVQLALSEILRGPKEYVVLVVRCLGHDKFENR